MSSKIILIISGKICSGKDTVADALMQEYPGTKTAFAEELKNQYQEVMLALDYAVNPWVDKSDAIRAGLQLLADAVRAYDLDAWARYAMRVINQSVDDELVYITDCRFPNELRYVQSYCDARGWERLVLRVSRPDRDRLKSAQELYGQKAHAVLNHHSEHAFDGYNFSHHINASTKEQAIAQALSWAELHLKPLLWRVDSANS